VRPRVWKIKPSRQRQKSMQNWDGGSLAQGGDFPRAQSCFVSAVRSCLKISLLLLIYCPSLTSVPMMFGHDLLVVILVSPCILHAHQVLPRRLCCPGVAFAPCPALGGPVTVSRNSTGSLRDLCSSQLRHLDLSAVCYSKSGVHRAASHYPCSPALTVVQACRWLPR